MPRYQLRVVCSALLILLAQLHAGCAGLVPSRNSYHPYLPPESWLPLAKAPSDVALIVSIDQSVPGREADWHTRQPEQMKLLADRVASALQLKLRGAGIDAKLVRRPGTRDPNWHQEHYQFAITSLPLSSQATIDAYDKEFIYTKTQFMEMAIDVIRRTNSTALLFLQSK